MIGRCAHFRVTLAMEDQLQDAELPESYRFQELVSTDLKLDSCQWEERSPIVASQNHSLCLEIDCLVSKSLIHLY